jgi:glycosyltransferase involved in cell wall biosynthesis
MHLAINAYFWQRPFTGSGQYTRQLVYHLNRHVSDLEITLIYPQAKGDGDIEAVPPSVNVKTVPIRSGHMGKVLFEQRGFPQACTDVGATIAHVPYWGAPLRSPIPLVVTVHDLTTVTVPDYRRGVKTKLYNALVTASAQGADHIITDSFASKLDIVDKFGVDERGVTAVYLAAEEQFKPVTRENSILEMATLRKYDLPEYYILYLGGYALHKNVMTLLHAYSYVAKSQGDDFPLVLAGKKPEPSDTHPDYDAYIERLGLTDQVHWIGFVDEREKPLIYRSAELFVFPSRHEGFGLPPLEAMACGTPVITTDADSLPEVVGDAAYTIDPDDARRMGGAMIALLTEPATADKLRQRGIKQAANFSWEKTAMETLMVYAQVEAMAENR